MTAKNKAYRTAEYIILTLAALLVVIPFLWMISTSFKTQEAFQTIPIRWIPEHPTLDAYRKVLTITNVDFTRAYLNSIFYTVVRMAGQIVISAMAAFIFAKVPFKGRNAVFVIVLITMMIPGPVVMIPNYLILKKLGLLNTYTGLILPSLLEGLYIFILRQFIKGIDNTYIEAAVMDGAKLRTIFTRIILPFSRPALFTLILFGFMGGWNDYLWPLIVLTRKAKWTLQVALGVMNTSYGDAFDVLMAGALISIIPIILVYVFTQRYVEKGVSLGGVKG